MSNLDVRDSESCKTVGDSCDPRRRGHAGKVIAVPLAKKGQRRVLELQGSLEPMWTVQFAILQIRKAPGLEIGKK